MQELSLDDYSVGDALYFMGDYDVGASFQYGERIIVQVIDCGDSVLCLFIGNFWFSLDSANHFLMPEKLIDRKDLFQLELGLDILPKYRRKIEMGDDELYFLSFGMRKD